MQVEKSPFAIPKEDIDFVNRCLYSNKSHAITKVHVGSI